MPVRPVFLKPWVFSLGLMLGFFAQTALAAKADAPVKTARDELQSQRYEKARSAAEQAIKTDPQDYRGHYYLAMAELGLGHADLARTAVDKALNLAPASARPGVEKLAGMVGGTPASPAAVFVSCNYSAVPKNGAGTDNSSPELTVIYKIEPQSFYLWDERTSEWKARACGVSRIDARWTGTQTCEYNERMFAYTLHAQPADADDHQYFEARINRLTGAFSYSEKSSYGAQQPEVYKNLANQTFESAFEGKCRAARDPSAAPSKF